jgi:AraC-like DNA-binding protein
MEQLMSSTDNGLPSPAPQEPGDPHAPISALHYSRFETTSQAPPRRLERWREAIGVLFEVQPAEAGAAEAPVVLDSWLLGSAMLTTGSGPGFSYDRSPRAIAFDGKDLLMIQVYAAGRCQIVRGAPAVTSEPGDLVVTDLAHPMQTVETAFRNLNLVLPRALLAPLLRSPDGHGGRVLRRDLPMVALVRGYLEELVRQAPRLPERHAVEVLDVTARLIAAALNGGADEETARGVRFATACELRRFIEAHLHYHDLGPEALGARFGLSRATVYRLFADEGGVRNYVRRRRLAHARLTLIHPAHRHRMISEISAQAGFLHAQDFIRAYRRVYGLSPGEEREHARLEGRARLVHRRPTPPPWVEWLRALG